MYTHTHTHINKVMNVIFTEASLLLAKPTTETSMTIERSFQILSTSNFQPHYLSIANHGKD